MFITACVWPKNHRWPHFDSRLMKLAKEEDKCHEYGKCGSVRLATVGPSHAAVRTVLTSVTQLVQSGTHYTKSIKLYQSKYY